ncbi:MAG: hypothetical protein Q8P20_01010 [bacterium]|nr:hypothetical protein [bacterium]MDZ4228048.1 hypothetical protein [Candidatus Levybacteria bacterium]
MNKKEIEQIREIHLRYIEIRSKEEGYSARILKRMHEEHLINFCEKNATKTCGKGCDFCPHSETDKESEDMPVFHSTLERKWERICNHVWVDNSLNNTCRCSECGIDYDNNILGVPRLQASKLPLSLTGRLKHLGRKEKSK